jgi:guanylate kinase
LIVVLFGPGGVGKGALVVRLVERDPRLWLSRSWTTRARRPTERPDAYVFVDRQTFEDAMQRGEFLETNEFAANGHLYGTPWPDPPEEGPEGSPDVVLEIDLNGARQVKARYPDAVVILVEPPSREELERRLRGRGDDDEAVRQRLFLADAEVAEGRILADHVVVNDSLDRATDEVARILDAHRRTRTGET